MSPMPGESTFHKASPSFGRLKEALEKLEARDKYRAKTKSPSDGDDVRWYFSKISLPLQEAAASVPATEVAGKGDFYRFSINDSLALEAAFLKQEEELVSAWWKEYAECSEGPVGPKSKVPSSKAGAEKSHKPAATDSSAVEGTTFDASSILQDSIELYENDDIVGVSVKGGLYEVDLLRRRCYPVYWTRDHRRVLRGHWFAQKGGIDWSPLREDISEQLEFAYRNQIWHRRSFQPSGKFAARLNLQGSSEALYALFTGEDDTWEAWLNVDSSVLSMVLGIWGSGIKLRRGFAPSQSVQPTQEELNQRMEEERDDYCSQVPVRHLVFMVHGIGQRLENANFVDDVGAVRQLSMSLADQHLTSHQRNSQRVLFIPCQWRRGLKLSGEEAVESCTLDGVKALRRMLSATVHDVLYYMSPVYCQDIIDTVTWQLNKLYCKFIKRNPGYDGKVSIYGHSLGSVLSYDILCHQKNLASSVPITKMTENREAAKDFEKQTNHNGEDTPLGRVLESGIQDTEKSELPVNIGNGCLPAKTSSGSMDNFNSSSGSKEERADLKALREEIARLQEKLSLLEEDDASKDREGTFKRSTDLGCEENATSLYENASSPSFRSISESQKNKSAFLGSQDDSHEVIATRECDVVDAPVASNSSANPQLLEPAPREVIPKLKSRSSSRKRYTPFIEYTKLAFEVDTFFAVGSPLGVFLSLRNVRIGNGTGKDYWQDDRIEEEMPACRRLLNIFHPFDPVAYRLEPLVSKEYLHKQPVFVPYHKGGKRIHIGMQEFGKDISARSKAFVHSFATFGDQVAKFMLAKQTENDDKWEVNEPKERTYGSLIMERLTGNPDGRIDYMLQDATFEHQYLQAISSHTSYWRDADTVLFILKHIYSDIPEKDPSSKAETDPARERESIPPEPVPLLNQTYLADEEVAFTFAEQGNLLTTKSDKNV